MNRTLQFGNTAGRPSPRSRSRVSGWGRGLLSLLTAGVLGVGAAQAQVANYAFAQTGGTYTAITGGTVVATATSANTFLDTSTFPATIPFSFTFNGIAYTTVNINSNGALIFGTASTTSAPISTTTAYDGAISVLGRDNQGRRVAPIGELRTETLGSGTSRTFVVQFSNFARFGSTSPGPAGDNYNFQVRLNETSNTINLVYGAFTFDGTSSTTAQVGLRGTTNADFNNRTITSAGTWAASNAGTTNSSSMYLSATVKPASGLTYTFTPPAGCTGIPTAGTAAASPTNTCSTSTITLTGGTTGVSGLSYQLQSASTSTGTYSNVGTASGTASFTATPTGTTFYRIVTTCTNSSSSATSAPVQVTTPGTPAYATLPYTQGFENAWINRCSTRDVPDGSWTQSPSTGNNTFRRYDDGMASGAWTGTSGTYTPAGSNVGMASSLFSARFHTFNATSGTQSLFDLYANVSGGTGTPTLTFDYINPTGTDKVEVLMSTDGGATFGAVLATYVANTSWTNKTVPLTGATATTVIRFRATSDFGSDDIGIDNVNVSYVGCGQVTGLTAGSITANSASLSFTAPSGATDYTVTYTPQGGTTQTVTPNPTASPVPLSGLMGNTLYTVSVITNCGGSSSTAATTTFTTSCAAPTYATLPYTQNFEGTFVSGCALRDVPDMSWKNTPSTVDPDASFRRDDDGASAAWTSPTFGVFTPTGSTNNGATGTHSARFHSSYATSGTIGLFDLYVNASTGSGSPVVSFDYINTSGTDKLEVLMSTDGGATFGSTLFTQVLASAWTTYSVTLAGATATTVVRFRATGDFGSTDIGLDNVSVSVVTCAAPSGITFTNVTGNGATVNFSSPGVGNTSYTVTATPTTGNLATANGSASPINLTNLQPGTAYSVVVAGNCGANGSSTASSFTTPAAPPTNDQCSGAIALTCGQTVMGTTVAATTTGDPTGTCGTTVSTQAGVFYTVVGTGQAIKLSTCVVTPTSTTSSPDTKMFVFTGSCGAFVCVGGNDDVANVGSTCTNIRASEVTFNSAMGTTYYVFVQGFSSAVSFGLSVDCSPLQNLTVSGTQPIPAGTYNNITVINGGVGTLAGTTVVLGTLNVQNGGTLNTNCQTLNGAGNFTLDAGGTLGICSTSGLSSTAGTGAVQMTGTRSLSTDASYVYNGTAAQSTGNALPATVRSLTVNSTAAVASRIVTLTNPLAVRQLLRLQSGNLAAGTVGVTLLSVSGLSVGTPTVGYTALIDNTGGVVTGTGIMQRAVDITTADNIGYHHYSSSVAVTTVSDLAVPGIFTPVFNGAVYNSAATGGLVRPFPTVFGYDQSRVGSTTLATDQVINGNAFNQGFLAPIDGNDPMVPGRGYTANVPNAGTVDFVGTFNNAPDATTVLPGLSNLARNGHPNGGFQLLGNPFPSPLDLSTIDPATQLTNMNYAVNVFHSESRYGGGYSYYLLGQPASSMNSTAKVGEPASSLIPAAAGFLMQVTTPNTTNGAVALTNANRVKVFETKPQPAFGRQTGTRALLQLQVSGAGRTDALTFYTEAQATAGVDARYDATKLANPNGLNLATVAGGTQLAIDSRSLPTTATVVPLFLGVPVVGSYTLSAASMANFGSTTVYLRDALTGTRTQLAAGTTYSFTTTATTAAGRFALEFAPAGTALATTAESLAAQVQLYPNPTSSRFHVVLPAGAKAMSATLRNALGQTVLTRSLTSNEADFEVRGLASGVYTLRLLVDGNAVTRKVVVE